MKQNISHEAMIPFKWTLFDNITSYLMLNQTIIIVYHDHNKHKKKQTKYTQILNKDLYTQEQKKQHYPSKKRKIYCFKSSHGSIKSILNQHLMQYKSY